MPIVATSGVQLRKGRGGGVELAGAFKNSSSIYKGSVLIPEKQKFALSVSNTGSIVPIVFLL